MNFREYTSEDSGQVVDLLNLCLERKSFDKITIESFEWKHFDKFFDGKTVAFLAEDEVEIVSFVCFTPIILNNQKTLWNCSIQATDSRFRRKGIVTKLTKLCEQKIQEITQKIQNNYIGFSNQSGIKIDQNSKSIGYQVLGQFNQLKVLPNPIDFISKILPWTYNNLNKIQNQNSKSHLTWFKNRDYLLWRYDNNPKLNFTKLQLNRFEIYLKMSKFKVEIYDIIGFDNSNNVDNLLDIINFVRREYLSKIITIYYMENEFTKLIFNRNRLLCFNKKIPIYFTVSSNDNQLLNGDNWVLLRGDII
jgi:hypothetical protein